ncbi:hypothetical protein L1887_13483 [Cichorium endivia]|nr:hypothetical protein L1887_13483 [Cichorium endivia]
MPKEEACRGGRIFQSCSKAVVKEEDEDDDEDDLGADDGDEDEDPFASSDEDISEFDSDQILREPSEESVVQETRMIKSANSMEHVSTRSPQCETPKETFPEKIANVLNNTHKLTKLLSRNLSIAEKLEIEGEPPSNNEFMEKEKTDSIGVKRKTKQPIVESRITRSQSRLFEENVKRRTRASSRSTSSGDSFLSINVTQRLEEIGAKCGMKKGKIGSKDSFKSCRKGDFNGNP